MRNTSVIILHLSTAHGLPPSKGVRACWEKCSTAFDAINSNCPITLFHIKERPFLLRNRCRPDCGKTIRQKQVYGERSLWRKENFVTAYPLWTQIWNCQRTGVEPLSPTFCIMWSHSARRSSSLNFTGRPTRRPREVKQESAWFYPAFWTVF